MSKNVGGIELKLRRRGWCWEEGASVVVCAWSLSLPFFGDHGIFDQDSSGFFSCVACECTLPPFPAYIILMRLHALCWVFLMRFRTRVFIFYWCVSTVSWELMVFDCYDISWWDVMVCEHEEFSWDFLMSFHAFWAPTRFSYVIFLWDCLFLSFMRCPYEISCLWPQNSRLGLGRRGWWNMYNSVDSSRLWAKFTFFAAWDVLIMKFYRVLLHAFLMRFPSEFSCFFWAVMRCSREI